MASAPWAELHLAQYHFYRACRGVDAAYVLWMLAQHAGVGASTVAEEAGTHKDIHAVQVHEILKSVLTDRCFFYDFIMCMINRILLLTVTANQAYSL